MSFRMYVLNIPSQYKLNYMAQEGKTDQSVQAEFDKVSKEYDIARRDYKDDKTACKDAKEARDEYASKQGLKPLIFDKKYRALDKKYDLAKEKMKKTKEVYKDKLRHYRQVKRQIREQYRAVKEFEKAKEMYAVITDPQNQKYVNIFPPNNIGAFMQQYQQAYDKSMFSYAHPKGMSGLVHPENIIDNSGSYLKLRKAYGDCMIQMSKEKARQVVSNMRQVARDTMDKVNDSMSKSNIATENER